MSFSDLPMELVRPIFEELFRAKAWAKPADLARALSLRLVCREFNLQVKQCVLGSFPIPSNTRWHWQRMNTELVTVILQEQVGVLRENDSQLVKKLRKTINALELLRGTHEKNFDAVQGGSLEILCTVAVSNLTQWRVFELPSYSEEVMMLSPAAAIGNINLMKELLKDGADVNASDIIFGSPLNAAAIGGHVAAARLLIEKGANIEYLKSPECGTALCLAARYGRHNVARLLLEKGARFAFDSLERQALHHAMANGGHEAVAIALIGNGAQVNAKTGHGETALHYAITLGAREAIIRLLIKRGADIDAKDIKGWTPLLIAAKKKREDFIKILLAKGANIHATDSFSKTILHHLVQDKAPISLIHLVVSHGIDLDAKDDSGRTVLHLAVGARQLDVITLLLENRADVQLASKDVSQLLDSGADVAAQTAEGEQALHIRAARGYDGDDANAQVVSGSFVLHLSVMEDYPILVGMLLEGGANPSARIAMSDDQTRKGTIPLYCGVENFGVAELLIQHVADVSAKNDDGETVFFHTVSCERIETVRRLAEPGADINTTNNERSTVLHESFGSTEMTATLLTLGVIVNAG